MTLFDLCERGNHFYKLKEYDRALYYYDMAIQRGYDGLQIIQRAQRLKQQGIKAKPPIHIGKAKAASGIRQEPWRQLVMVKANYPSRLVDSLEQYKECTLDPDQFETRVEEDTIFFTENGTPVMEFIKLDEMNLQVTCQYFTEMEKYFKVKIVDGKEIKIPAKRKKYHFFIIYDSFTDLLAQFTRVRLLEQTYYEEHRQELVKEIDDEFGSYKQLEISRLPETFVYWLEMFSVLHHLFRTNTDLVEIDYLKSYIHEQLQKYLGLVERSAIYKIDYFYIIIVLLEKLYQRFPAENKDKFERVYDDFLVCRKFDETFNKFLEDISQKLISEPVLHEFAKFIGNFRENLFA